MRDEQKKRNPGEKMAVIDTIKTKEKNIRELLVALRNSLNSKHTEYNENTNDWSYLTILSFTESKLRLQNMLKPAPNKRKH